MYSLMTTFFYIQFKKLMTIVLKTGIQKLVMKMMRKWRQQCANQFQHTAAEVFGHLLPLP
jgi:hypothetical protein